jgi:thioredoxin 1
MAIADMGAADVESKVLGAQGPAVLDFYQASCPPCRALEPRLERMAAQYADKVPLDRVNIDRDLPVAQRFDVMSLPTVLVFRDGKEIERLDGLVTDAQLKAAFERAAGRS